MTSLTTPENGGRIGEILAKLDGLKEGVDELKDGQADQRRVAEELRERTAGMAHLPAITADHELRMRIVEARQFTTPSEHAELKAEVAVLRDRMRLIWAGIGAVGIALLAQIAHYAGLLFGGGPAPPPHP